MFRAVLFLGISGGGIWLSSSFAADAIREKLDTARIAYEEQCERLRKDVESILDKREQAARKSGDKKTLDQVKAARQAFDESGDLPTFAPDPIRRRYSSARVTLENAYSASIREFTKNKRDSDAEMAEEDLQEVLLTSYAQKYLVDLEPFATHVSVAEYFSRDGTAFGIKIKLDGREQPHSVFLHPETRNASHVTYRIDRSRSQLRGRVVISSLGGDKPVIGSPLTFEIVGDGKVLWASKPIQEYDKPQSYEVAIDKLELLQLRVQCPGPSSHARAVWLEPKLMR